jgi:hypothetical protein
MRAKEFLSESEQQGVTINIPITITIPAGGGGISIGANGTNHTIAAPKGEELPESPVYVSPLQQELELKKQQGGKASKVINQILRDDGADSELGDSEDYFDDDTPESKQKKKLVKEKSIYSLAESTDVDDLMAAFETQQHETIDGGTV